MCWVEFKPLSSRILKLSSACELTELLIKINKKTKKIVEDQKLKKSTYFEMDARGI